LSYDTSLGVAITASQKEERNCTIEMSTGEDDDSQANKSSLHGRGFYTTVQD